MNAEIIQLSDGRKIELRPSPWGDVYSLRINVIGPRGGVRESFVLSRSCIETMLSLTKKL